MVEELGGGGALVPAAGRATTRHNVGDGGAGGSGLL
jgi:hypothetical protein